jgi:hypothetical protein
VSETQDDITGLLREAQDRGLNAWTLLSEYSATMKTVTDWYRQAGRAFAEEGLQTDVLERSTHERIENERQRFCKKLRGLLGQ